MFVVKREQIRKSIRTTAKRLSGLIEQALSDRPATVIDPTNIIHALKPLACQNCGKFSCRPLRDYCNGVVKGGHGREFAQPSQFLVQPSQTIAQPSQVA